jgi:hypothetical protein
MGIRNQRLEKKICILEYFSGSFSNAKKELVNRGTNNQALFLIHQIKFSNQLHYSFLKNISK